MKLTIYAIESKPITAIKAIREALRALNPHGADHLRAARDIYNAYKASDEGFVVLGEVPNEAVTEHLKLIRALRENGVFVATGDPARARRRYDAEKMREAGATPEEVFEAQAPGEAPQTATTAASGTGFRPDGDHATALALTAIAEGDPLNAAAFAALLCRAQGPGSAPLWRLVQQSLIATWPAIESELRSAGLLL